MTTRARSSRSPSTFSEEIEGLSYVTLRDSAFVVSGGDGRKARRKTKGSNHALSGPMTLSHPVVTPARGQKSQPPCCEVAGDQLKGDSASYPADPSTVSRAGLPGDFLLSLPYEQRT